MHNAASAMKMIANIAVANAVTTRSIGSSLSFCATYVLLSWASHLGTAAQQFTIAPWDPAPALGLLTLVRHGSGRSGALFVAIVISQMLRPETHETLGALILSSGLLALGYTAMAAMLKHRFPDDGVFANREGLLIWSIVVIFGSLAVNLLHVAALSIFGTTLAAGWQPALLRFWTADSVGIFVAMPLLWWLADLTRRTQFRATILCWETSAYVLFALFTLWFAFVPGGAANYRYFYVLFLPLVWAASRQGFAGAVFCSALLQLGILAGGILWNVQTVPILELQMRALILALVGFLIGVAIDEQRRIAIDYRRSLHLAAAGEMAAALAHELNQPLTALSAYGSACAHLLSQKANSEKIADVVRRMIVEATRAAAVVRRLRDFFRTGTTHLEHVPFADVMAAAAQPFIEKAPADNVRLSVSSPPGAILNADSLQLEVVLRNLLSNAFDAVAGNPEGDRHVCLTAELVGSDRLNVVVKDNGPGIRSQAAERLFEPFTSTKSSGLGLGLTISRAIAEAHGGSLTSLAADGGCFLLTLPVESVMEISHG